ncbi:ArnT family glycosyltransferase [Schlesneria paludicola]|uniref:ArnT family glycosyltransferase n=1 Tax=Schlesneria paludicola TaxID=360056 RepID=UPI00029ABF2B|nr:glycosyltransferase family 39 protein [Schlesneria paludicola]
MSSIVPSPVTVDDSKLLALAKTPRAKLFPTLNRASAFAPLIVACCVLPAFQLLNNPTLNELGSLWALRSLAVANATSFQAVLEPGINEPGQPFTFQPPLMAWLDGFVLAVMDPSNIVADTLVSLIAAGITIWLTSRMAWRIGGANTALVAALLMCSHPQLLEIAITSTNGAISLCLMLATAFGIQRHLEISTRYRSPSLIISGVVFGLTLLAVGPVAFTIPLVFALHAISPKGEPSRHTRPLTTDATSSAMVARSQRDFVIKSTLLMTAIGLVVGGWWGVLMTVTHGMPFVRSWWLGLPVECLSQIKNEWRCDLQPLVQPPWQQWFREQALIIAWLIVGLERSWHVWRRPPSEYARRRHELLVLWWTVALIGRVTAEVFGMNSVTNTYVWNLALLAPTILLASLGIGTLIERAVSRRGEYCLMILLASLTMTRISSSWLVGLISGASVAIVLLFGPRLFRSVEGWSESGWRQVLQVAVYGSLMACVSVGLGLPDADSVDESRLADLRDHLEKFPEVRRISLVATRDPCPVTLRYLLRCRWPQAELVTTEGWDTGLTTAMLAETSAPESRFLVLEWTRRDIRLTSDTDQTWRITAIGDPMRFHGRRLSMVLIEPRG